MSFSRAIQCIPRCLNAEMVGSELSCVGECVLAKSLNAEQELTGDDCATCGEIAKADELPIDKCPEAKRACGHHCNHVWTSDACCWCGMEYTEGAADLPVRA